MFKTSIKLTLVTALVAAATSVTATPAEAAFEIRITDSLGHTVTVQDNMAGDLSPTTGAILIDDPTFLDGHLSVLFTTGTSKPLGINGPEVAAVDLGVTASYDGALGGGVGLTIEITDTNFNLLNPGSATLTSTASNANAGGVTDTWQSWATNNNTEFSHGAFSLGQQIDPSTLTGTIPGLTNPFQLGGEVILTFTGGAASVSIGDNATVSTALVPAPAGILLALSSMPALSLGYWFRQRQTRAQPVA
jgi:hypothetical protein